MSRSRGSNAGGAGSSQPLSVTGDVNDFVDAALKEIESISQEYNKALAEYEARVRQAGTNAEHSRRVAVSAKGKSETNIQRWEYNKEAWARDAHAKLKNIEEERRTLKGDQGSSELKSNYKAVSYYRKQIKKQQDDGYPERKKEEIKNQYEQILKEASTTLEQKKEEAELDFIKEIIALQRRHIELGERMDLAGIRR